MKFLVASIAKDFLQPGPGGRRLGPGGARGIALGAEIADRLGSLAAEVDEVLRLCILLEREGSLEAAKAIEQALAGVSGVARLLSVRGNADLVPHLQRRRLRLLNRPRAPGQLQIREILVKTPPHRAKHYSNRV